MSATDAAQTMPARDPMARKTIHVNPTFEPDALGVELMHIYRAGGLIVAVVPGQLAETDGDGGIVPIAYHVYYVEAHRR